MSGAAQPWDEVVRNYFEAWDHKDTEVPEYLQYNTSVAVRRGALWGLMRNDRLLDEDDDYSDAEWEAAQPGDPLPRRCTALFSPRWDACEDMGTGCSWGRPHFDPGLSRAIYFVRVRRGTKWGVVDTGGREIAPCKWDEIDRCGNARLGDRWGFVNLLTGEETPPQWAENPRLHLYETLWSATVPGNEDYFPVESGVNRWKTTMRLFRAGEALCRAVPFPRAVDAQDGREDVWRRSDS